MSETTKMGAEAETAFVSVIPNVHYYPDTDSLYIDLSEKPSVESTEVAPGVVLDFDATGQVCGVDIDYASQKYGLPRLELEGMETYLLSQL